MSLALFSRLKMGGVVFTWRTGRYNFSFFSEKDLLKYLGE